MKKTLIALTLAAALIVPMATPARAEDNVPPGFTEVYNGYGRVSWNPDIQTLTLSPKAAEGPNETHAALVVSQRRLTQPYRIAFTIETAAQLRTGSAPNPWETGWFVFGYKPDGRFKYLLLKPGGYGLELGESLLNNRQNFLYTSPWNVYNFPINTTYDVVITAKRNIITVFVNGVQYLKYKTSSRDALNLNGQYGFYAEDAAVQFSHIAAEPL